MFSLYCNTLGKGCARVAQINKSGLQIVKANGFASKFGEGSLRRTKVKSGSLKEKLMAPATDSAFNLGKGVLAGASVVGLGGLCYYGLGLSNEVGAVDRAALWPAITKDRIKTTYMYFGGSLIITAASAVAVSRNVRLMRMMTSNSWLAIIGTMGAMIGTGMVARSIPYKEGFGSKQLAWLVHSGTIGAVIAPMTLLGGPLLLRAALYTAGIVGGTSYYIVTHDDVVPGLSMVAVCAPSEKFLNMGGPLAMGLGVVFMSSIGSAFLPPTTALGAGLYSVAIYGGLVLFGMFLLYDTQKIIKRAETHPAYAMQPYDPVNNSISIYLDTINIFIRIAMIMAGGGGRRK